MKQKGVLIGVPSLQAVDPISFGTIVGALAAVWNHPVYKKWRVNFVVEDRNFIHSSRNSIFKHALEMDADVVIQIDDDMVPKPDTFVKLLDMVSKERPFVAALSWKKAAPFVTTMWRLKMVDSKEKRAVYTSVKKYKKGELVEIDASGFGCFAIHTSVLRKMSEPYCRPWGEAGEDFYFCAQLKNMGYKLFTDTGNPVGHLGTMIVSEKGPVSL